MNIIKMETFISPNYTQKKLDKPTIDDLVDVLKDRLSVAGRELLFCLRAESGNRAFPSRSSTRIFWCICRRGREAAGRIAYVERRTKR